MCIRDRLYSFLEKYNPSAIQTLHIGQLAAPTMRTYEGGVEQAFLSQHIVFKASYFHNEFGKEIEYVGLDLVPALLPNLTPTQQATLEGILKANFAYEPVSYTHLDVYKRQVACDPDQPGPETQSDN